MLPFFLCIFASKKAGHVSFLLTTQCQSNLWKISKVLVNTETLPCFSSNNQLAKFLAKIFDFKRALWPTLFCNAIWPSFGKLGQNLASKVTAKFCCSKQFGQDSGNLAKTWPVGQVSGLFFYKSIWPSSLNFAKTWPVGQVSGQVISRSNCAKFLSVRNVHKFGHLVNAAT